jgi:hypothetical protein
MVLMGFSQPVIGLGMFPGTLLPILLHLGGNISDGSLCAEVPHLHFRLFPLLHLLVIVYICVLLKVMSP